MTSKVRERSDFIEYCKKPSLLLTDKFIINQLYLKGISREESKANPDLIECERTRLKIIRLLKLKNIKNEKHNQIKNRVNSSF